MSQNTCLKNQFMLFFEGRKVICLMYLLSAPGILFGGKIAQIINYIFDSFSIHMLCIWAGNYSGNGIGGRLLTEISR